MLVSIQTKNFRMLANNRVELRNFHVLVGQNATGKSTFLGALQFVADVLRKGVAKTVDDLGATFYELCFDREQPFDIAVEMKLGSIENGGARLRYEIRVGIDDDLRVQRENLFIIPNGGAQLGSSQLSLWEGSDGEHPPAIQDKTPKGWRRVVQKTSEGIDYFRDEKTDWNNQFRFGPDRPALGSLPEDPQRFPLSIAARNLLRDGVRTLALDPRELRTPSAPGAATRMAMDGSNLPHVVRDLAKRDPVLHRRWVEHLATGVPGLVDVSVHERPEDRKLVLEASFAGLHERPVPSWLLSDGTLRLMALTLLSYAARSDAREVYLVEEPENGLHPLAIQTAFDALAAPGDGVQVLCATHSPIFLAQVLLDQALVFRRSPQGFAIVRHGTEVPELKEWQGKNLTDLFVTGVLS